MLDKSLGGLGSTTVRSAKSTDGINRSLADTAVQSRKVSNEIDQLSGRLRLFADLGLILGPALAPIGALAVGGLVTFAAQLGSLAGGLGVTLLATNGLSDGLKALNEYQLHPTTENLAKLNEEMERLGPSGERFVRFLDSIEPQLKSLQTAARDGALPGFEEGIESLLDRLPEVRDLISLMASGVGGLAADAGKSLAGDDFDEFFEYLRTDGVKILDDTARTMGNLALTAANLFDAFAPLQTDFSGGILAWTEGLAEASADLESSAGFQTFLAYIEETGPQAVETLGSLANAALQIVEATAPLGGPVLQALEGLADSVAAIADSDLGTPIFGALAALALYNRAAKVTTALNGTAWGAKATAGMKAYMTGLFGVISAQERAQMTATQLDAANRRSSAGFAKAAGGAGLLAFSMSGLADKTGLSNTAMLSIAGPWGTAAGLALDVMHATDGLSDSITVMNAAMRSSDPSQIVAALDQANAELDKVNANTVYGTTILGDTLGGAVNFINPLTNLSKTMGRLNGDTAETESLIGQLTGRLEEVRGGATGADFSMAGFADVMNESAEAARDEADALRESIDAMREKRSEALRAMDAELNYQQAIDDARKSIKENGKTADETTEKGRNNLRTLYALADGWNQQSNAAKNAKGSLDAARDNFLKTADAMGVGERAAKRLADQLFEIPPKRKTEIEVDSSNAEAKLRAVKGFLDSLRDKTIHINTVTSNSRGGVTSTAGGHSQQAADDPAPVPKPGRVAGNRAGSNRGNGNSKSDDFFGLIGGRVSGSTVPTGAATASVMALGRASQSAAFHMESMGSLTSILNRRLKEQQSLYDNAKSNLDAATGRRDSISSSIQSGLAGGDLWEKSAGSVWSGGGVANPVAAANARADRARRLVAALNTLRQKGVAGPALLEIIGTGDVERAEMMAALPIEQLSGFSSALNTANAELAAAGLAGGNALEGQNIAASQKELVGIRQELREVKQAVKQAGRDTVEATKGSGAYMAEAVNGAAGRGHKRGKNGGGK